MLRAVVPAESQAPRNHRSVLIISIGFAIKNNSAQPCSLPDYKQMLVLRKLVQKINQEKLQVKYNYKRWILRGWKTKNGRIFK